MQEQRYTYVPINKFDFLDTLHNSHLQFSSHRQESVFFPPAKTSGMTGFAFVSLFWNLSSFIGLGAFLQEEPSRDTNSGFLDTSLSRFYHRQFL